MTTSDQGLNIVHLRPHNVETFAQAKHVLETQHQVAIVQATGTGKSYIMLALLESLFQSKRVLYVVPYLRIGENFMHYKEFSQLDLQFDVCTYNTFGGDISTFAEKYDVLLIDEFHHLGSAIYGKGLWSLKDQMVSMGKYVVAASATPVRPLDSYRDMGAEAFETCVVNGITAAAAVEQGVLPKVQYALALHAGVDDELNSDGRVNFGSCVPELQRIVSTYCNNTTSSKWLAYIPRLSTYEEVVSIVRDAVGGAKFFFVHSKQSALRNEAIIAEFLETTERSVLVSVDMLLEGTHLPVKVAGLFNFRHIVSPNVFWQMLGRLYDSNNAANSSCFINIAGTKFYRPKAGNWMWCYSHDIVGELVPTHLNDVTSIEVFDSMRVLEQLQERDAFELNGVWYSCLTDYYQRYSNPAVCWDTFMRRVREGWSLQDAISKGNSCYIECSYGGKTYTTMTDLADTLGLSIKVVHTAKNKALANGTSLDVELGQALERKAKKEQRELELGVYSDYLGFYEKEVAPYGLSYNAFKYYQQDRHMALEDIVALAKQRAEDDAHELVPIRHEGVTYSGIMAAARALGISKHRLQALRKDAVDPVEFEAQLAELVAAERERSAEKERRAFCQAWYVQHCDESSTCVQHFLNKCKKADYPTDDESLYQCISKIRALAYGGVVYADMRALYDSCDIPDKVSYSLFRKRMRDGVSVEKALARKNPKEVADDPRT